MCLLELGGGQRRETNLLSLGGSWGSWEGGGPCRAAGRQSEVATGTKRESQHGGHWKWPLEISLSNYLATGAPTGARP